MGEKRRRNGGAAVPIAKRMQQSADLPFVVAKKKDEDEDDIEAKIKALEAQLDSSSSEDDSDPDDDGDNDKTPGDEPAILSLSAYQNEKVPALPSELLPKAQAFQGSRLKAQADAAPPKKIVGKVPFACKPCGFVGKDLADFQAHKASDGHNDVVGTTGQRLSCKLCAKDFTSAEQLAEHKLGKWHLMRKRTKKDHFHEAVRVCYDFMRGNCFRGDQCSFSHDDKNSKHHAIQKPTRPCTQFKAGTCKFGDRCIFLHTGAT